MLISGDVGILQPQFAVAHDGVRAAQVDPPLADRFNLGADQCDTGLDGALHKIIVVRLPIDRDDFNCLMLWCSLLLLLLPGLCHNAYSLSLLVRTCICCHLNCKPGRVCGIPLFCPYSGIETCVCYSLAGNRNTAL